ncbi:MAG: nuclear transport factor 2 family protein [Sphingobium sp.]
MPADILAAADDARIAALETRLSRLEAERDILATFARYGHSIDYGREADWVDCFAPDAVYDVILPGEAPDAPPGIRSVGTAELAQFAAAHSRAPDRWHKHLVVNPVFAFDADLAGADVESYFLRVDAMPPHRVIYAQGRYKDRMRLCPDGRWRFARRRCEVEAMEPPSSA